MRIRRRIKMRLFKKNICAIIEKNDISKEDFKDWIIKTPVYSDSGDLNDMKKWVKYSACIYPDADCVLKINDEYGFILQKLGWYDNTINEKNMYIDCIFSMATFFNAFLRFYAPEYNYKGQLMDSFDEIFSDNERDRFCRKNNIKESDLSKLFVQLNRFSRNTHTIGNYMPCPDNKYNSFKGYRGYHLFKDRIELLYLELKNPMHRDYIEEDRRKQWIDWFYEKESVIYLNSIVENKNLLAFTFNKKIMGVNDIVTYSDYLKEVNNIIENRGNMLMKSLKKQSFKLV